MLYNQFKEFFLDGFHTHKYDKYIEDGTITIDYTYLPSKNGKTYIKFNIPETDIGMTISYGGSSQFAMWWCQLTDGLEDDDDNDEGVIPSCCNGVEGCSECKSDCDEDA